MCEELTSCLCGYMCCVCCVSAAESDKRSRRRRECRGHQAPVYVQPVVVTTVPTNSKAHRGHQHPNGYYYVQQAPQGDQVLYHPTQYGPQHKAEHRR
uniref:Uncharacterized protein n=1 Tax=Globisporangium ultimum (strain ATCC 200006 / CBS 805.95 / DAOM BR144) TaxID=431595 RepID=K3XC14_GLOUD